MFGKMRKSLAMFLVLIMVVSMVPAEALAAITDGTGSVYSPAVSFLSLFETEGEAAVLVDTYEYVVDGQVVGSQRVVDGDELLVPATPEKPHYKFVGWYEGDSEFTGFGTVTGATGVTHTITAVFQEVYYVFFKDAADGKVVYTAEVQKNGKIGQSDMDTAAGIVNLTLDAEWVVTDWKSGDTAAQDITVTDDVYLVPVTAKGFWVIFDTAGGSYVAPHFCKGGESFDISSVAEPSLPGYTFAGWYEGSVKVTGTVSKATNLVARWNANTNTNYTVIHWLENADDTGYTFKEAVTQTGTTGGTTAAKGKSYDGFTVQAITQKTIAGDGSTIVNVYYKRNVYQVTFQDYEYVCGKEEHNHSVDDGCYERNCDSWHSHSVWKGCYDLICTKQEHSHGNSCYKDKLIVIEAKWGADISDQWPGGTWQVANTSNTYQAYMEVMPIGGAQFKKPSSSGSVRIATYYVEVLPGEAYETEIGGVKYKVHHVDRATLGTSVTKEDQYDLSGYTFVPGISTKIGGSYNGSKFYYTRNTYDIVFINNGTTEKTITKRYQESISDVTYKATTPPAGKEGYVFGGWYDNEVGEGEEYVFSGTMPAQGIVVYAKWVEPQFDAVVYLTATAEDKDSIKVPYGKKITESPQWADTLAKVKNENGGEEPDAWFSKEGGTVVFFNLDTILYSDITIYPYYKSQNQGFQVTYSEAGSSAPVDNEKYAIGSYASVKHPIDTENSEGEPFLYWQANGMVYYPGDKVEIKGDVTLEAVYGKVLRPVIMTYHANNGTGDVEVVENIPANSVISVKGEIFSRSGYIFKGWARTADATEHVFVEGNKIMVTAIGSNDLYAVWETLPTYNVIYMNGNQVMSTVKDEKDYFSGETATVLGGSDVHDNSGKHNLVGYVDINTGKIGKVSLTGSIVINKASDLDAVMASEHFHRFGSTVTIGNSDYILYAVWADEGIADKYTVTYDLNGGASTTEQLVYTDLAYGVETPTVAQPTRLGYTFGGWDKAIAEYVTEDVTYTAVWTKDITKTQDTKYTVRYTIEGIEQSADTVEVTGKAWINDDPAQIAIADGGIAAPADKYVGYKLDENNPQYPAAGTMVDSGSEFTVNYVKKSVEWSLVKTLTKINGKEATGSEKVSLNDVLTYTITITNSGEASIHNITVVDEMTGLKETVETLAAGASKSFTTEYTVAEKDILAGVIVNTAVADGTSEADDPTHEEDTVTVTTEDAEGVLIVEKTSDATGAVRLGDTVTYTVSVTNKGNVTITGITVADELPGIALASRSNEIAALAPGQSVTVKYTYSVTEYDIIAGKIVNNVSATGTDPKGNSVTGTDSLEVLTELPNAQVVLDKETISVPENEAAYVLGESIRYRVTVTNIGNLTLVNVLVVDELTGDNWIIDSLTPGEEKEFFPVYDVTEQDILEGTVTNIVTATGECEDPNNPNPEIDPDDAVDLVEDPNPSLYVEKTVTSVPGNGSSYALGETVAYSVTVKNDGNLTLVNILVVDELTGDNWIIDSLTPGEEKEFFPVYDVTEKDILEGKVVNTVTVAGTDPKGGEVKGSDSVEVATDAPDGHITLKKETVSKPENGVAYVLGETVEYKITVTNDGNLTLTNVVVVDELTEDTWTVETMAPGAVEEFTAVYTVTEDDVLEGKVINVVTAKCESEDPKDPNPEIIPDDSEDPVETEKASLYIEKKVTSTPKNERSYALGETITYTVYIENNGNLTISNIVVEDTLEGVVLVSESNKIESLAPGEEAEIEYSYVVTEKDILEGKVVNVATAKGTDPSGKEYEGKDEVESIVDPVNGHVVVEKSIDSKPANGETYALGETIRYTIKVKNDGNVTLTNVVINDELTGDSWTIEKFEPKDEKTYTAEYTVTAEDIAAGTVVNTVTFKGTDPKDKEVEEDDDVDAPVDPASASMTIDKEVVTAIPERGYFVVGETIEYSVTVTNTGNVSLNNVVVTDELTGDTWTVDVLEAGGQRTFTASYTVAAEDAGSEGITNTAVVNAKDPSGNDLEPESDTTEILPVGGKYTLTITYVYTDGTQAAASVVESLYEGATFHYDSPEISGYTANTLFVSGAMPAADVAFTITYSAVYVAPVDPPTEPPVEVEIGEDPPVEVPAEPTKGLDLDPETLIVVPIAPGETPLDNVHLGDHIDCALHFILILAAFVVYCAYTSDKKKYQKKIQEYREQLAMEKKNRGESTDEE